MKSKLFLIISKVMPSKESCWNESWDDSLQDFNSVSPVRVKSRGLDEEQYRLLCKTCDRVLLAHDSTIECIAISWLHVIREHPMLLTDYAGLFEPDKEMTRSGRKWLGILRSEAAWIRRLIRAFSSTGRHWECHTEPPNQTDILFISHLINASHAGQASDFYYGELPDELARKGFSVSIALINHTDLPSRPLVAKWKKSMVPRMIFTRSLGLQGEIAFRHRLKRESLRLRSRALHSDAGLSQKVLQQASREALSGISQATLRLGEQVSALVAKLKPKVIVVTHEGHAWERIAFSAARRAFAGIRCVAYQHAALFRLQHAIQRNLADGLNPDVILTSGVVSKTKLERAPGLKGIPVSVLGSNRTFKRNPTTAGDADQRILKKEPRDGLACLVLPEGYMSECRHLFEFSLACAKKLPEIRFIWRLHPSVTYEALAKQSPKFMQKLPENIELSSSTLEEDIRRSRWVLYRGTTAVVQAAVAGLRPMYLQLPGEMTIDPLYELETWRAKISDVSGFERVVYPDAVLPDHPSDSAVEEARKYCELLFTPINAGAIEALIPD
jgi:hypothetical protein